MGALRLRPLTEQDEQEALRAHEELAEDDFGFLLGYQGQPWEDLLAEYDAQRCGRDLPEGYVPATFLVAEVDGDLVGRVSVRHDLNDWLAHAGGHVGYGVRPASRRRGHATEILRQALVVARAAGVDRVLVTCDDDNAGSAAVIERCGGVLEGRVEDAGVLKRRYWID